MEENPQRMLYKRLAAALLFLTLAAVPPVLGLGAHVLAHHEHGDAHGHGPELSGLAASLVHGHQHAEGFPEHEHRLLLSPAFRPDPPRDLIAPVAVLPASPDAGVLPSFAGATAWQPGIRLFDPGPPRLHLLCALLI